MPRIGSGGDYKGPRCLAWPVAGPGSSLDDVDLDLISVYLKALSHPGRLELLWHLRTPVPPSDVTLRPRRRDQYPPERAMSRQGVAEHLARLEAVGIVARVPGTAGAPDRVVTDVRHLFAFIEEFRRLTAIPAAAALDPDETAAGAAPGRSEWPPAPRLALPGGPWEGRAFPLRGDGPWTVGRSRSATVALTYDPFVSAEHAIVRPRAGRYELAISTDTRNPSRLNSESLPPGATCVISHGDVLWFGRSVLVFQER